jgi:hypothetical protein
LINNNELQMESGETNDAGTAKITVAGGEWWQNDPSADIQDESTLNFEGGAFYWAGDHITEFSSLVADGKVTYALGRTNMLTGSWDVSWTNDFVLNYGYWSNLYSSTLYADYNDVSSGYTTIWSYNNIPSPAPPVSDGVPELYTFTDGTGDQLWTTAGNWDLLSVPTVEDDVDSTQTNVLVIANTDAEATVMNIGSEFGTSTVAVVEYGTLSVSNVVIGRNFGVTNVGKLVVDGGDVNIEGTLNMPEFGDFRTGILELNSGNVSVGGRTVVGGIVATTNNSGLMVINDGTFNQTADRFVIGQGGDGTVIVNGGELLVTTDPTTFFNPLTIPLFDNPGNGTLIINNDAWVESSGIVLGNAGGATGDIYLNGGSLRTKGGDWALSIEAGVGVIHVDKGVFRQFTDTSAFLFGVIFTTGIQANGGMHTMLFETWDFSWVDGDSTLYIKYDIITGDTYVWAYTPPVEPVVPPILSIAMNGGNADVSAVDLVATETYELQSKGSLTDLSWSAVGTTSGVTTATWSVPATNSAELFQVEVLP